MSSQDKTLECSDCGNTFTFSTEEYEYLKSTGYTNAKCPSCSQMFPATCAECGKDTEVPFEPHDDKPVYCYDCWRFITYR